MMTKPLDPKNTVLLVALEKELPKQLIPTWNIYYTGVGKVNAALSVVAAFNLYKPNVIINYGTVGSLNPKLSGLIKVNKFLPSISSSLEKFDSDALAIVGNKSMCETGCRTTVPSDILAGHRMKSGTLIPPSNIVLFQPLNGLLTSERPM